MVTVTPATGLHNGQTVQVTVSGFPPGKAHLSECASASDANPLGCGVQLAAQSFVEIENGGGTEPFTVTDRAPIAPLTSETVICTTGCVLVATAGESSSGPGGIATAPIAFAS
jgi:neocarzinostatin family protein